MRTSEPDSRLIDRVAGNLLARYIGHVYRSSTAPPLLDEHLEIFRNLHPFILAIWHGQFMLLPALPKGGTPTRVMLALHRDAELMAVALRHHDLELIRGAGAGVKGRDRGGANAFRAAAHALETGFSVAMTADVPPGPARRCGHGIVTLAKVSGRPILPIALASSRFLTLNTWSRMTINLPRSSLGASMGEAVHVPADATIEELERCRLQVERQLNVATVDAYARAGADPFRAMPPRIAIRDGNLPLGRSLKAYRKLTTLARPLAPLILSRRAARGKEDLARRGERLGIASVRRPDGPLIWFHAASVGETNAVLPLISALQDARPDHTMLLTTGTVTSATIAAKSLRPGQIHQYVPLDSKEFVAKFLDYWRPRAGVFTESEIWPNLVIEASTRHIPLAVVNARMSRDSFRSWRKRPGMANGLFSRIDTVLAQNQLYALRYGQLGAGNVVDVGNLKFDAPALPVDIPLLASWRKATGDRQVWLAASTHPDEESIAADVHCDLVRRGRKVLTMVVPRHPERGAEIAESLRKRGLVVALRSRGEAIDATTDIYLGDTVGELGTFYAAAPIAFIGKSLSRDGGGHNPIEGIHAGSAILSGPAWQNFDDMFQELLAADGMMLVRTGTALADAVDRLLTDDEAASKQRERARSLLRRMAGSLEKTRDAVLALLPAEPTRADKTRSVGVDAVRAGGVGDR